MGEELRRFRGVDAETLREIARYEASEILQNVAFAARNRWQSVTHFEIVRRVASICHLETFVR